MKYAPWIVTAALAASAACDGGSSARIAMLEQRLAQVEKSALEPVIVTPARARRAPPGTGGDGYGGSGYGGAGYGGQSYGAMEATFRRLDRRLDRIEHRLSEHDKQINDREEADDVLLAGGSLDAVFATGSASGRPISGVEYAVPIAGSFSEGAADAPVTWVIGIELSEPYSLRLLEQISVHRATYGDRLRVVYKHMPVHRTYAGPQALAWCAATKQGKLHAAIDDLRAYYPSANPKVSAYRLARLRTRMITLGIDLKRFDKDVTGPCRAEVKRDHALLLGLGSTGTPVSYFNGYYLAGAQSEDKVRGMIDEALARASAELGTKRDRRYYDRIVKRGRTAP